MHYVRIASRELDTFPEENPDVCIRFFNGAFKEVWQALLYPVLHPLVSIEILCFLARAAAREEKHQYSTRGFLICLKRRCSEIICDLIPFVERDFDRHHRCRTQSICSM